MAVFVDTSALLALVNAQDLFHPAAREALTSLREAREPLVTTNYVLVEALALIQRRQGMGAATIFQANFVPILTVAWVDEPVHRAAVAALLTAGRRELSLVDCVSFEVMRERGIAQAFSFDADFAVAGFELLPA